MTKSHRITRLSPPANDNGIGVSFESGPTRGVTQTEIEVFLHFASDLIAELDSANDNTPTRKGDL